MRRGSAVFRGSRTARAWAIGGLICYAAAAVAVLALPVSYSRIVAGIGEWLSTHLGLSWFGSGWIEFAGNVLIFMPLGLLFVLLSGRPLWGLAAAVAMSVTAEAAQLLIPLREPSLRDVLANALGALIGAGVGLWMLRRSAQTLDRALPAGDGLAQPRAAEDEREH